MAATMVYRLRSRQGRRSGPGNLGSAPGVADGGAIRIGADRKSGECGAGMSFIKRLSRFKMALILGCVTEGAVAALMVAFGSMGPCGPNDTLSAVIMVLHLPGALLAAPVGLLSDPAHEPNVWSILTMSIMFGSTALIFSGMYSVVVR